MNRHEKMNYLLVNKPSIMTLAGILEISAFTSIADNYKFVITLTRGKWPDREKVCSVCLGYIDLTLLDVDAYTFDVSKDGAIGVLTVPKVSTIHVAGGSTLEHQQDLPRLDS